MSFISNGKSYPIDFQLRCPVDSKSSNFWQYNAVLYLFYFLTKKSLPILCNKLPYPMGQDFFDTE